MDIHPAIKELFDEIIEDSPGFQDMLEKKTVTRDWIYDKLSSEFLADQAKWLEEVFTPNQFKEFNKLQKKSPQKAGEFMVTTIPNYEDKANEFADDFYEYYV